MYTQHAHMAKCSTSPQIAGEVSDVNTACCASAMALANYGTSVYVVLKKYKFFHLNNVHFYRVVYVL